jgi:hypothetical protein
MKRLIIILFLMLFATMLHRLTYSQEAVPRSVLGNGGAALSSGDLRMFGTVGQAVVGVTSNSSNINKVGFWYFSIDLITSVEPAQTLDNLPTAFRLEQNYPNPFNPSTTIRFAIPQRSHVTLKLYDILGRKVATLVDERLQPGEYKVVFDAGALASGVYVYRIQAGEFVRSMKLMLLK